MKRFISLMLVAFLISLSVVGQAPDEALKKREGAQPPVPASPQTGAHEMTAADVEAFLDGLVPLQIKQADIAGATISVVKDGKLLFAKGYGYADVKNNKPVSPQDTLFRPGSISKLFTWTAIMQLYEQGKLDLDRDINTYLDFKTVHVDRDHAVIRTGKTRSGPRHQPVSRLQNSRRVRQADHSKERDDSYARL